MKLDHSEHWKHKKKYRKDISDGQIEYAIANSDVLADRHWENALNAICRIPPSGKILKVVYRRPARGRVKVITAFWLD